MQQFALLCPLAERRDAPLEFTDDRVFGFGHLETVSHELRLTSFLRWRRSRSGRTQGALAFDGLLTFGADVMTNCLLVTVGAALPTGL